MFHQKKPGFLNPNLLFLGVLSIAITAGSALANINKADGSPLEVVKLPEQLLPPVEEKEVLERAAFVAFEAASKLQQDNAAGEAQALKNPEAEKLKTYLASLMYIPKATNLPSDDDVLDEPWANKNANVSEDGLVVPNLGDLTPHPNKAIAKQAVKIGNKIQSIFKLLNPVENALVSSPFGIRWGRPHQGIDLAAPLGASILSAEAGKIVYSGWKQGYGNFVAVDHGNGYQTHYAHCSSLHAKVGQVVKKGQLIARVGSTGHSTGPHLHFEVLANGVYRNPAKFLNRPISVVKLPD